MATIPELVTLVNLAEFKSRMVDLIYPVGSILQIENTTFNPNDRYPGTTWTRVSGVFLFASDGTTDGETGGEATHTLTVDEMPSHGHYQKIDQSGYTHIACSDNGDGPVVSEGKYIYQQYVGTVQNSKMFSTFSTGGGQPHNNMPPYRKVSMWRRTA